MRPTRSPFIDIDEKKGEEEGTSTIERACRRDTDKRGKYIIRFIMLLRRGSFSSRKSIYRHRAIGEATKALLVDQEGGHELRKSQERSASP